MRTQSGFGPELYTHALVQIDQIGGYLWELDNDEVRDAIIELRQCAADKQTAILTFHPKDEDQFGSEFTFVGTCKGIQRFTTNGAKLFKEKQDAKQLHVPGNGRR